MKVLVVVLIAAVACARTREPTQLEGAAIAIAVESRPRLDALVARIVALKRELRGDRPGWQDMLRLADAANDLIGLPPFTQSEAPGPAWRPSPATLLGIEPYVRGLAPELAIGGRLDELRFLVVDERRRYDESIAAASTDLDLVERWLASPQQ